MKLISFAVISLLFSIFKEERNAEYIENTLTSIVYCSRFMCTLAVESIWTFVCILFSFLFCSVFWYRLLRICRWSLLFFFLRWLSFSSRYLCRLIRKQVSWDKKRSWEEKCDGTNFKESMWLAEEKKKSFLPFVFSSNFFLWIIFSLLSPRFGCLSLLVFLCCCCFLSHFVLVASESIGFCRFIGLHGNEFEKKNVKRKKEH